MLFALWPVKDFRQTFERIDDLPTYHNRDPMSTLPAFLGTFKRIDDLPDYRSGGATGVDWGPMSTLRIFLRTFKRLDDLPTGVLWGPTGGCLGRTEGSLGVNWDPQGGPRNLQTIPKGPPKGPQVSTGALWGFAGGRLGRSGRPLGVAWGPLRPQDWPKTRPLEIFRQRGLPE